MSDLIEHDENLRNSYSKLSRLSKRRSSETTSRTREAVSKESARAADKAMKFAEDLSLAEQLWHLDSRLKPEENTQLKKLFSIYQSIIMFDTESKEKLRNFEKTKEDSKKRYEDECKQLIGSVSMNEANARSRYEEAVKKYAEERDEAINKQIKNIEDNYNEKVKKYEDSYVKVLDETQNAINIGTNILNKFNIRSDKLNVLVNEKEASTNSTSTLLNRIKTAAVEINNLEYGSSGVENSIITDVNNLTRTGTDQTNLNYGLAVASTALSTTKSLFKMTANVGKRIKNERNINLRIKECSEEMVRCVKLLIIRKNIAKALVNLEKPDSSAMEDEKNKIRESENNKYMINVHNAEEEMNKEISAVTLESIKPVLTEKKNNFQTNMNILTMKHKEAVEEFKHAIDIKIKDFLSLLNNYIESQDKIENLFDINQDNAVDASPENVYFKDKVRYKKMLDVFSERKLINSLDLKMFLPEGAKIRDWYLKIKYDVSMFQRKKSIVFDIEKICKNITAEFQAKQKESIEEQMKKEKRTTMTTEETECLNKTLSEDEVLDYINKRYKECERKETELFKVTTSNKYLGRKETSPNYLNMTDIVSLATNKEFVGDYDNSIFETCISKFSNKSLMFVYKNEEEADILSNLLKNFIYNTLIDHHTESIIVNVVNVTGDVRFKDLQVSRDYVSTDEDTKGKIIKGPKYVKLFETDEDIERLAKDTVRQEQKLTNNDLVGKMFSQVVKDKRDSGGIVPKFTINVIIKKPVESNWFTKYNEAGESKGILNIYFIDKDTLIKQSYDSKENKFNSSISFETMKAIRTVKNIVEVVKKNGRNTYLMDVSYEDNMTHCVFNYKKKTNAELEGMRSFLEVRSVKALKNKVFTTTTEFIEDIITNKGLKLREKEQQEIDKDKNTFDQTGKYSIFDKKYSDCSDFVSMNRDTISLLKKNINSDTEKYKEELIKLDEFIKSDNKDEIENSLKFIELYKTNCNKIKEYDKCEDFINKYDDRTDAGRDVFKRLVYEDINKRQKALDYKNEVNPKCYWEGSCLKTLPLYMGYVNGDKTKPQPIILDETQKPHYFIAGTTGGGKSVALGAMVNTLKMMFNPQDVEVVYFDFKVAEVAMHAAPYKMPQCSAMCGSAASEYLMSLLRYVNHEMDVRYEMNKNTNTNKLSSLIKYQKNKKKELGVLLNLYEEVYRDALDSDVSNNVTDYLSKIVEQRKQDIDSIYIPARMLLLVDEAAQAFQTNDDELRALVKEIFIRLAQLARAAGIHILLVSQDADKMPDALMNLLKIRGCTVAPRAISTNVLKNDFCARPENQFIGFFGVNDMDGAEEANVQYVVPFNREEDTTSLTKIADSLCNKMKIASRNAVIFDDNKIYSNELHEEQLEKYKDDLDGQNVLLGEGVYYTKVFKPHLMRFREQERSGAVIISPVEDERTRIIKVMIESLKGHAYISPVYCRSIPKDFPPEYFYELPFNKENGHKYMSAGRDIISQKQAIEMVEQDEFDQFMVDDIFGRLDDSEAEVRKVPSICIKLDEPQEIEGWEIARTGTLSLMEKVKNGEMTQEEFEKELQLNLGLELKDNALWKYKEVGLIDSTTLETYNQERTFLENVMFLTESRKDERKKDKNKKFIPMYFVMFEVSKHKGVLEAAYSFWKEFNNVINEAALYNIHVIISDNTMIYHEREVGGYYMLSNADSVTDIPRKWKGVDKNLMKLVDITETYSALVKLPKDDPDRRKQLEEERVLVSVVNEIKDNMPEKEREKYMIDIN